MIFVSAEWADEQHTVIKAIDDTGRLWWVPPECDNGTWLEFLGAGGVVGAFVPTIDDNVLSAPEDLFGGPTLFGG